MVKVWGACDKQFWTWKRLNQLRRPCCRESDASVVDGKRFMTLNSSKNTRLRFSPYLPVAGQNFSLYYWWSHHLGQQPQVEVAQPLPSSRYRNSSVKWLLLIARLNLIQELGTGNRKSSSSGSDEAELVELDEDPGNLCLKYFESWERVQRINF